MDKTMQELIEDVLNESNSPKEYTPEATLINAAEVVLNENTDRDRDAINAAWRKNKNDFLKYYGVSELEPKNGEVWKKALKAYDAICKLPDEATVADALKVLREYKQK